MFAELAEAFRTTTGESLRQRLLQFQSGSTCTTCHGQRLNPAALSLKLASKNIADFLALTIPEALSFTQKLSELDSVQSLEEARRGLEQRLTFLNDAGLTYLTLNREINSLSGGEGQPDSYTHLTLPTNREGYNHGGGVQLKKKLTIKL